MVSVGRCGASFRTVVLNSLWDPLYVILFSDSTLKKVDTRVVRKPNLLKHFFCIKQGNNEDSNNECAVCSKGYKLLVASSTIIDDTTT